MNDESGISEDIMKLAFERLREIENDKCHNTDLVDVRSWEKESDIWRKKFEIALKKHAPRR